MDLRAGGARVALVLAAWLSAQPAFSAAAKPLIYSDVCFEEETGDHNGAELVVWRTATAPKVRFTLCEGGCYQPELVTEPRLSGNRLTFTMVDTFVGEHGRIVRGKSYHFAANLGARAAMLDPPREFGRRSRLPRRKAFHSPARARSAC
jgi:hypothetical protein